MVWTSNQRIQCLWSLRWSQLIQEEPREGDKEGKREKKANGSQGLGIFSLGPQAVAEATRAERTPGCLG